jgi:hypothetical protein
MSRDDKVVLDAMRFAVQSEVTVQELCQYLTRTLPMPPIDLSAESKVNGIHVIATNLLRFDERRIPRDSQTFAGIVPMSDDICRPRMTNVRKHPWHGLVRCFHETTHITAIQRPAGRLRANPEAYEQFDGLDVPESASYMMARKREQLVRTKRGPIRG